MQREYIAGSFETERGYSPVVKTVGGTHVWVAGQTGARDATGKVAYLDIENQTRQCFRNIESQLAKAGGQLSDLVYVTVFLKDQRHGPKFLELRREIFNALRDALGAFLPRARSRAAGALTRALSR
jgi:2-iminobutanoate/2-iminopropanoate deaminase